MLLKQQNLSPAGLPAIEYVYRQMHPLLQFLPQKWVDWQELGWRVESACKSWIQCRLECWKAEHYFTAMPCVWQKGPKYPHLSDVGIRIWPLPWNYAGSLLPFWCAGIPISRIQCQGTLHVPLLLPVHFCLQILGIYHVFTMYIRSIWLTFFVPQGCLATIPPYPFYTGDRDDGYVVEDAL